MVSIWLAYCKWIDKSLEIISFANHSTIIQATPHSTQEKQTQKNKKKTLQSTEKSDLPISLASQKRIET